MIQRLIENVEQVIKSKAKLEMIDHDSKKVYEENCNMTEADYR